MTRTINSHTHVFLSLTVGPCSPHSSSFTFYQAHPQPSPPRMPASERPHSAPLAVVRSTTSARHLKHRPPAKEDQANKLYAHSREQRNRLHFCCTPLLSWVKGAGTSSVCFDVVLATQACLACEDSTSHAPVCVLCTHVLLLRNNFKGA